MPRYYVITPEFEVVIPILDDGTGPIEPARDVVEVEAPNKREAIRLGYHELKKIHNGWINYYRDTDRNPFVGLFAELIEDEE